jgi:outer membrane protein TolC
MRLWRLGHRRSPSGARADRAPDPQIGLRAFSERGGEETGLGVTFAIPLGGAARSAAASEQFATASAARQEAYRIKRAVAEIAATDAIRAESEHRAWSSAAIALEESSRMIQRMRDGFAIGASSLSDLLAAERRHLTVRLLEADARARSHFAMLKLQIDAHELWLR